MNTDVTIKLDGVIYDDPVDGLSSIRTRIQKKRSDNKLQKSFSEELVFHGQAYEYIKQQLIDDPQGRLKKIRFEMFDLCCLDDTGNPLLVFEGIIRGDSIDWCDGECFVSTQIIEETDDTQKIDCMKSTLIFDNRNGFQSQDHPRVTYCLELRPSVIHDLFIILGWILILVLTILYPIAAIVFVIVTVINAIISVINLLGGNIDKIDFDGDDTTNVLEEYTNLINLLKQSILGCGRQHPSPLVRDYVKNACDICGMTFQSSIYNDPSSDYYNAVYYNAPVEKGTRDTSIKYIIENKPIKTLEGFLEDLKLVHNADYEVKNGVLYFERKDFFWDGDIWVDTEDLKSRGLLIDDKVCYSWRDDPEAAFARLSYTEDPVDWVGNEARDRYNDIVEWNSPFNSLQVGPKEYILPFGMCRFRGDGIDRDVYEAYAGAPFFAGTIASFNNVVIQNNGTNFQPKLLIWDGVSLSNAKIKRYGITGFPIPTNKNYNFPYLFNEFWLLPNSIYPSDHPDIGLYGRFFSIDNPKVQPDRGLDFEFGINFANNCEIIRKFSIDKSVQLPVGEGRIENVDIDWTNRIIDVKGIV